MRLIDADEVQKIIDHIRGKYVDTYNRRTKVNQFFWDTIRYIEKKVRSIPTVEAKEVVYGAWILGDVKPGYFTPGGNRPWICSECGKVVSWWLDKPKENFCSNCGADMRKKV